MMSRGELRNLATRWMRLWQGADLDAFDELHADHFVDRSPSGRRSDGTGFRTGIVDLYAAMPQFYAMVDVLSIDEAHGSVAIRWTARRGGSERADITGIEIIRCTDGRVAERWGEWDAGTLAAPTQYAYRGGAMVIPFVKMHGCGNDFLVLDARAQPLGVTPARAAALADRRTGVGCDQLIVLEPPPAGSMAAVFMRIRNPDGSEAGACGNATRCVASLLDAETGAANLVIETIAGPLPSTVGSDGRVTVDMGPPGLDWAEVPLAAATDTLHLPLSHGPVSDPAALSIGNPHATFFVPDADALPVAALGPALEHHPIFPERANIGFATILAPDRIRLRVWERGAGETRACGSAACAALVNAARRGLTGRRADILADGGKLGIEWREDGHVLMAGPVATSFRGTIDLAAYPA